MSNIQPQFMTIRQVAATGIMSEFVLRRMEKAGELPCIYTGKRCLVHYDKLLEKLGDMSDRNLKLS